MWPMVGEVIGIRGAPANLGGAVTRAIHETRLDRCGSLCFRFLLTSERYWFEGGISGRGTPQECGLLVR